MAKEKAVIRTIMLAGLMLLLYLQPADAADRKIKARVPGIT